MAVRVYTESQRQPTKEAGCAPATRPTPPCATTSSNGASLPGTVLAEVEQSERLGVSRTPLREALSRLTAEGLTTTAGGRGVVVTDISLEDIDELFELRETLEGKAAALAAERGDAAVFDQLHAANCCQAPGADQRRRPGPARLLRAGRPAGRRHRCRDLQLLPGPGDAQPARPSGPGPPAGRRRRRAAHRRRRRTCRHRRSHRRRQPPAGRGRHHTPPAPQPFPRQSHPHTALRRSTMVKEHHVRVYKSEENLPREDQLALQDRRRSPPTPSRSPPRSPTW